MRARASNFAAVNSSPCPPALPCQPSSGRVRRQYPSQSPAHADGKQGPRRVPEWLAATGDDVIRVGCGPSGGFAVLPGTFGETKREGLRDIGLFSFCWSKDLARGKHNLIGARR